MSNKIIIGGAAGAILGLTAGLLTSSPFVAIATGIVTGTIIGMSANRISGLFYKKSVEPKAIPYSTERKKRREKLVIRREELDISKKRVLTGEVSVHKEVSTENKTLVVPVTREELVIEKKVLGNKKPGKPDKTTIRIPVKTEEIDIVKHPVTLENVSVYKRKLQKNQRIKATVKTERLRLESEGDPRVKDLRKYRVTNK